MYSEGDAVREGRTGDALQQFIILRPLPTAMIRGRFESVGDGTPAAARAAYDEVLAATVTEVGIDRVTQVTDVDRARLEALCDGESPALTLTEATAILATQTDRPDAETLAAEARDILLMGMSIAVLDVEALASGIDDRMEPREIQQKVEGRAELSLDEYALLHSYIESQR